MDPWWYPISISAHSVYLDFPPIEDQLDESFKRLSRQKRFASLDIHVKCKMIHCIKKQLSRDTAFTTRMHVRIAKTHISLLIRSGWSESKLSAWRRFKILGYQQNAMSWLIGLRVLIIVFTGRTINLLRNASSRPSTGASPTLETKSWLNANEISMKKCMSSLSRGFKLSEAFDLIKIPFSLSVANSVDPDRTPQNAAADHGLHCLSLIQQFRHAHTSEFY